MSTTSDRPERPDREYLRRLLSQRNQYPDLSPEIDALVRDAFERHVAILALDMCGFSRLTRQFGIIAYLAMIVQMEEAARPAVVDNHGIVIKQDADNLFAIFETPRDALEASFDIFRAFAAVNSVVPVERDIFGSIGIGYGPVLVIEDADLFGDEMNIASKLGEDLAGKMEILLTPSAHASLPPNRYACTPLSFEAGSMVIDCFRVDGRIQIR